MKLKKQTKEVFNHSIFSTLKFTSTVLLLTVATLYFAGCTEDKENPVPEIVLPEVISNDELTIQPGFGRPGENIVITGNGFVPSLEDNIVTFNGQEAEVKTLIITNGEGTMVVSVPLNATNGPIEIIGVNEEKLVSPEFTVIGPHTISAITPTDGEEGTVITITGTLFSTELEENIVTIGPKYLEVIEATETMLKAVVPANTNSGSVKVSIFGFEVAGPTYTSIEETLPQITLVTPTLGTAGTTVSITGKFFNENAEDNLVSFNGVSSPVTSATVNGDEIVLKVLVPEGASSGALVVTVDEKEARWSTPSDEDMIFTVSTDEPWINQLTVFPRSFLPGFQFTFEGSGFSPAPSFNKVTIDGVELNVIESFVTGTYLKVEIPNDIDFEGENSISGPLTIAVNGISNESDDVNVFIFKKPPVSLPTESQEGQVGEEINILSTTFPKNDPDAIVVWFESADGKVEAEVTTVDYGEIAVIVPEGTITGKISLQIYGGEIGQSLIDFELTP